MKKIIILSLIITALTSCSKGGDDRIAEQENIRAREQVNAENDNRRVLSEGPEKELNKLKYFMLAVTGEYKGVVTISGMQMTVYVDIYPENEIFFYDRIRTPDEVLQEKSLMFLTVNTIVENANIPNSGTSCSFFEHRPNINKGLMKLANEGCKNKFQLNLNTEIDPIDIISNREQYVDQLIGHLLTGLDSHKYKIILERQ